MRVLTLNAWGAYGPPERRPVLAEALRRLDADLLLLQEANVPGLLETLPYPARLHSPETGLAILSRFPLQGGREIRYRTPSRLEPHLVRGALAARVEAGSLRLHMLTTHLAWKAQDGAVRLAQVEELLEAVAVLEGPILIGGDFNTVAEEPPIQRMLAAGFEDLNAAGGITWDNRNPFIQSHLVHFPDRRIDYLFLRGTAPVGLGRARCKVVFREPGAGGLHPSDHYGVLALFQR